MLILHAADLHLCDSEREYSLSVLEEIVALALSRDVAFLLLSGDTFDSFDDVECLRSSFRKASEKLPPSCEVLLLQGNHEDLGRGKRDLQSLDLGPVTLLVDTPFSLIERDGVEFLTIPHQANYSDYRQWKVPQKKQKTLRIAIAHGVVVGVSYAGPDQETGAGVLDPDIFTRFGVDYAALGHIHIRRRENSNNTIISYPGSARVWRRGELGERGVCLLNTDELLRVDFLALKSAGRYREHTLPLSLEGKAADLSKEARSWSSTDWIHISLTGLVEEESVVASLEAELRKQHGDKVRKLEIVRDDVSVLPGISSQPLASRFLALWDLKEPQPEQQVERRIWLRARELALAEIKRVLEARD